MTKAQREFFNKVIKPRSVEMTIRGNLPADLNDLQEYNFESAAEQFNKDKIKENAKR